MIFQKRTQARKLRQAAQMHVQQNIATLQAWLSHYPPFSAMQPNHVIWLLEAAELRFYPANSIILSPSDGTKLSLHIIKQGQVRGYRQNELAEMPDSVFEIGSGECFPLAALIGERQTRTKHVAVRDTFCLVLSRKSFDKLLEISKAFCDFARQGVSTVLREAHRQMRIDATSAFSETQPLTSPLKNLITRSPVTCRPDATLKQVIQTLHKETVGSMVVVDEQSHPLGIFTLKDMLRLLATEQASLEQPISTVMTPAPVHLVPEAAAFETAMTMVRHGFSHICVVENQRLVGVVSERDLFALQRLTPVQLGQQLREATDFDSLGTVYRRNAEFIIAMLGQGASAAQLIRLISMMNDQLVKRTLMLCLTRASSSYPKFFWLCFGSEGRQEQSLFSDQDNGILFIPNEDESLELQREQLVLLAQQVNQVLDQLGVPLCPGNIMAGNPAMCLSLAEWQSRFVRLLDSATPENLLDGAILFDYRLLDDAPNIEQTLRQKILSTAADAPVFLRLLAEQAVTNVPPLGMFGELLRARRSTRHNLDIKRYGIMPFVDGARLLSLQHGVGATNTVERIMTLAAQGSLQKADADGFVEAYEFVQLLRLRLHHQQQLEHQALGNQLDPASLSPLDQRILREALRQAKRFQNILKLRFHL